MKNEKRWWEYSFYDFLQYWRWRRWRKMALKAIAEGRTSICEMCKDYIFPDDFVAVSYTVVSGSEVVDHLVHAGIHFTRKNSRGFICEKAVFGSGYWSGDKLQKFTGLREPLASKVV